MKARAKARTDCWVLNSVSFLFGLVTVGRSVTHTVKKRDGIRGGLILMRITRKRTPLSLSLSLSLCPIVNRWDTWHTSIISSREKNKIKDFVFVLSLNYLVVNIKIIILIIISQSLSWCFLKLIFRSYVVVVWKKKNTSPYVSNRIQFVWPFYPLSYRFSSFLSLYFTDTICLYTFFNSFSAPALAEETSNRSQTIFTLDILLFFFILLKNNIYLAG